MKRRMSLPNRRFERMTDRARPATTTPSSCRGRATSRHRQLFYHVLALCSVLSDRRRLSTGRTAFAAAATIVSNAESSPSETHAGGSRSVAGMAATGVGRGNGDADLQLSAAQMAQWLGEVEINVMVDVVLVGFHEKDARDGLRDTFVALDDSILQEHLDEIVRGLSLDGKGGVPITVVDQELENEIVPLGIRQQTVFEVSHARSSLSRQVKNAVAAAVRTAISVEEAQGQRDVAVVGIPRTAVDDAIRLHHEGQGASYSLYLLHPNANHRYEYVHAHSSAEQQGGNGAEYPHEHTFPEGCGYVGWVGQHLRYAWLDLGAYMAAGWGPRTRALGVVSPSTLPNLAEAAAAVASGRSHAWLYPELAALAHRSASQLIVPPLLFTPAGLRGNYESSASSPSSPKRRAGYKVDPAERRPWQREKVVVRLFLVCETSPCPSDEVQAWAGLERLLREPEGGSRQTRRGGSDRWMPRVAVEREEVALWESPLLATGLQQAVQPVRGGSLVAPASISLAAPELRHWLRLFLQRKGDGGGGEGDNIRVVSLFAIILDTDSSVLLNHSEQSTAFPDMVISVKGREGVIADSGFHCGGRNVLLRSDVINSFGGSDVGENDGDDNVRDDRINGNLSGGGLLRSTVASLAQLIWGASPRTLSWDPLTNTLGTDYLWATGASVHTPLSPHSSLAFPERDAYPRTRILRRVEAAVTAARDVLEQAAAVEPRLSLVLYANDHADAVNHWHQVKYTLVKCLDELAVHHHESALRFSDALEDEVGALGVVLSRGYGSGMYSTSCSCSERVGDGLEYRERDEGVVGLLSRVCDALFAAAALCVAVAAWWKFARRASGSRREFGGWRKHKHN